MLHTGPVGEGVTTVPVIKADDHNHNDHTEVTKSSNVERNLKEKVRNTITKPLKQVFEETMTEARGDDVENFPVFTVMYSTMQRERTKPPSYSQMCRGSEFGR